LHFGRCRLLQAGFEMFGLGISPRVEGKPVDTGTGEQVSHLVKGIIQVTGAAYVGESEFLLHGRRAPQGAYNAVSSPVQEGHAGGAVIACKAALLLTEAAGENQGDASRTEHLRDNGVARLVVDEMGGNMVGVGEM